MRHVTYSVILQSHTLNQELGGSKFAGKVTTF